MEESSLSVRVRPMVITYRGGEIGKRAGLIDTLFADSMILHNLGLCLSGVGGGLQNRLVRFDSGWALMHVLVCEGYPDYSIMSNKNLTIPLNSCYQMKAKGGIRVTPELNINCSR